MGHPLTPERRTNIVSWIWFFASMLIIIAMVLLPGLTLYLASALLAREWGTFGSFVGDTVFAWALWYLVRILLRRIR